MLNRKTILRNLNQRGITLLEVLVTLLIIAIGLLGMLGMQAKSLSSHKDSFDRKAAVELLSQMTERMRSNHLGFMNGNYASDLAVGGTIQVAPGCGSSIACSPADIALADISQWQGMIRTRLIDSAANISPNPAPGAAAISSKVTIAWKDPQLQAFTDKDCEAIAITDKHYRCISIQVFP